MGLFRQIALSAGLLFGCNSLPQECRNYNETTITLNGETDGKIDSIAVLPSLEEGQIIHPVWKDFVNEVQGFSGRPLPPDLKLTLVPTHCGSDGSTMYAFQKNEDNSFQSQQRGIYVKESVNEYFIHQLLHEIGHFDHDNYKELLAEVNSREQSLIAYAFLATQLNSKPQLIQWRGLDHMLRAGYHLANNSFNSAQSEYVRADVFLFMQLQEVHGNFNEVRQRIHQWKESGILEDKVDETIAEFDTQFLGGYPDHDYLKQQANILLAADRFNLRELQRLFGPEVRRMYLDISSYFNGPSEIRHDLFSFSLDKVITAGLEDYNCRTIQYWHGSEELICKLGVGRCDELGAGSFRYLEKALCCDQQNNLKGFQRFYILANGHLYRTDGERSLRMDSFGLEWPYGVEFFQIESQRKLSEGESCSDL